MSDNSKDCIRIHYRTISILLLLLRSVDLIKSPNSVLLQVSYCHHWVGTAMGTHP